jgi:hypothetical protein
VPRFPQVDYARMIARNVPKRMGIIGAEGPQLALLGSTPMVYTRKEQRTFLEGGDRQCVTRSECPPIVSLDLGRVISVATCGCSCGRLWCCTYALKAALARGQPRLSHSLYLGACSGPKTGWLLANAAT